MKLKLILIFFGVLCLSLNTKAQDYCGTFKISSFSFPNPCVENFIRWLDLSTLEWETEMKKYQFTDRGIDQGAVYYGSGASLEKAVFSISKWPGSMMSVTWEDFSLKGITKLDALISELEPYYNSTDEKMNTHFQFTNGEFSYEFTVHRSNSFEFVVVKRTISK